MRFFCGGGDASHRPPPQKTSKRNNPRPRAMLALHSAPIARGRGQPLLSGGVGAHWQIPGTARFSFLDILVKRVFVPFIPNQGNRI
jgi:hypothetical protein